MLRKIVGWVRLRDESWEVTMRRMKYRVEHALKLYVVMPWRKKIGKCLWDYVLRIKTASNESWIKQSSMWLPNESEDPDSEYFPYRCRGRPCLQWDTSVRKYCTSRFNSSWQLLSTEVLKNSMDDFINYFCACELTAEVSD